MRKLTTALLISALAAPGVALAAGDEITMQVIDGESPDAVTRQIELPDAVSDEARTRSADGLETANQSRQRNRKRVREMEHENDQARRERRQEMHEQQQQMQRQQREMQMQQQEMQDGMQMQRHQGG